MFTLEPPEVPKPDRSIIETSRRIIEQEAQLEGLPHSQRVAWAIERERLLTRALRAFDQYHAGYVEGTKTTTSLVLRLLKAIEPLLLLRGDRQLFNLDGTAPRLREAYQTMKEHLGA